MRRPTLGVVGRLLENLVRGLLLVLVPVAVRRGLGGRRLLLTQRRAEQKSHTGNPIDGDTLKQTVEFKPSILYNKTTVPW